MTIETLVLLRDLLANQTLAVAAPDFEVMAQRTVTALAELDAAIQKHG